jgi:hypothetical protein
MKRKNPDSELLREGYKSYHKAVFAVMEFRREAGKTIQSVVEKRAPELAAAMKLDKDKFLGGICQYTFPDRLTQKYDGSEAFTGIRIPRSWASPWIMSFYFFIRDDEQPKLIAQVHLKNPGPASKKLVVYCKESDADERDPWISEIIPADGSRDLVTVCNRVMDRWITVWRKVGGLRQFLPKTVRARRSSPA